MKVRQRQNKSEEHCAVCRDGPEGLVVCRGCNTLLHASCLIDVRGCPTIGCNELDPLQEELDPLQVDRGSRERPCLVHSPHLISASCREDLFDLWGGDVSSACTCGKGKERIIGFIEALKTPLPAIPSVAEQMAAAADSCKHSFDPYDHRCVHCQLSMLDHAEREFGSSYIIEGHTINGPKVFSDATYLSDNEVDETRNFMVMGLVMGLIVFVYWLLS